MTERKALYAGSFDPPTKGHVSLIETAARLFDRLYVGVGVNTSKRALFSLEEKLALLRENVAGLDNVTLLPLDSGELTVTVARRLGCEALVRGIRNVQDLEYETSVAKMNATQEPAIETVFLLADERYRFVSSSIVKEIASFGGDLSAVVPANVNAALKQKYNQ